jgi:hypothetical protein
MEAGGASIDSATGAAASFSVVSSTGVTEMSEIAVLDFCSCSCSFSLTGAAAVYSLAVYKQLVNIMMR